MYCGKLNLIIRCRDSTQLLYSFLEKRYQEGIKYAFICCVLAFSRRLNGEYLIRNHQGLRTEKAGSFEVIRSSVLDKIQAAIHIACNLLI
jgi:hypothetical protein